MHTRTKALAELKSQDAQFSLGCVDLSWDELKCPRFDMHRSPRQVPCSWLFAFPSTLQQRFRNGLRVWKLDTRQQRVAATEEPAAVLRVFAQVVEGYDHWVHSQDRRSPLAPTAQQTRERNQRGSQRPLVVSQSHPVCVQSFSCPLAVVKRPLKWLKTKSLSFNIF